MHAHACKCTGNFLFFFVLLPLLNVSCYNSCIYLQVACIYRVNAGDARRQHC